MRWVCVGVLCDTRCWWATSRAIVRVIYGLVSWRRRCIVYRFTACTVIQVCKNALDGNKTSKLSWAVICETLTMKMRWGAQVGWGRNTIAHLAHRQLLHFWVCVCVCVVGTMFLCLLLCALNNVVVTARGILHVHTAVRFRKRLGRIEKRCAAAQAPSCSNVVSAADDWILAIGCRYADIPVCSIRMGCLCECVF